jgi:hypothetical protein
MTHIRRYLAEIREGLIHDVAGREVDLTTGQAVLIDRAISLLGVIRTVEEALAKSGILRGGVLAPILRENYLAYTNSLRLLLRELGIDRRAGGRVMTPLELVKVIEAEQAEAAKDAKGPDLGTGGQTKACPGASWSESQGGGAGGHDSGPGSSR